MQLPKKINPQRIRDAVVQLYFHADVPFEPLIGYLYAALLEEGFSYTNRPIRPRHFLQPGTQTLPDSFDIMVEPQYFFFNDHVRIKVESGGSLVFNCMDTYPGWSMYFEQIQRVVRLLLGKRSVRNFHRIGMRYISEFPNIDILENVNFKVELKGLEEPMVSGNFRVEWVKSPFRFVVNLASKLPITPLVVPLEGKARYTSLIDIDVIYQNFTEDDPDKLFLLIEQVHQQEKEQFYHLLKPDFLETLHPEYE